MPGKILGIDINEDFISAVQISGGLKGFQVLSGASVPVDHNPEKALNEISEKMNLGSETYVASIDGNNISYQNLTMPFKDPKKIKQTLPFELETLLPFPADDIVVDFNIVKRGDQSDILAVSARKALVSQYLEAVKTVDIHPRVIDIRPVPIALWLLSQEATPGNGLVIDIGQKKITYVLFIDRKIALIRNTPLASAIGSSPLSTDAGPESKEIADAISMSLHRDIKNTLRSFSMLTKIEIKPEKVFITGIGAQRHGINEALALQVGIPVEPVDVGNDNRVHMDVETAEGWNPALMSGALSLALREFKKGYGFNLRKGEFAVKKGFLKSMKELRVAGIAFLIIFALLLFDSGADYYLVKKKYDAAVQKNADLFRQLFPDVHEVKFPLQQLKQKIEELKKSSLAIPEDIHKGQKMLDLINDISQKISKSTDIDVSSMVIDSETIRISGQTDSFNTINTFKSDLESSAYFSDIMIMPAKLDKTQKKVEFELKLQRK
jgi:general secretion pathway protein L